MTLGVLLALPAVVLAADKKAPEPDPQLVGFVQRAIAWYPDSTFKLVENSRHETASGAYRVVAVERNCASKVLTGTTTLLVDEDNSTAWMGSVGQLPLQEAGVELDALQSFVGEFLPQALKASMNLKVRVQWNAGPFRPGALIPFDLMVDSGYGEYRKPAAVTADGAYLVLGSNLPLKKDPVTYRRELLAESDLVIWDTESGAKALLEIVEFSDLECPACRSKWPVVQAAMEKHGSAIRHGMVSFPLTNIHPWAFRAAAASWCVTRQGPKMMIPLKEIFYSLQREMEVSLVTPTVVDFVAGQGLSEEAFRACYLREPSLKSVLGQMSLGQRLGVRSTPTYYVNGWMVQVPAEDWFPGFIERLLAGEEP
ncbi:MAG: DsbA family protein [Thermoanaerobaculales bacterium]